MALIVETTNRTTQRALFNGDDYFLPQGVLLTNQSATALNIFVAGDFGDNEVLIAGSIVAGVNDGIAVAETDVSVTVTYSGLVSGKQSGISVFNDGDDLTISNAGTIHGGNRGIAVTSSGQSVDILNSGQISADNVGVELAGVFGKLTNTASGTILAHGDAIELDASGLIVSNAGAITGGAYAIDSAFGGHTISNSGQLNGDEGAIRVEGGGTGIVNSGTIIASGVGIDLGDAIGDNHVTNSGLIRGAAHAIETDNRLILGNSGTLAGEIAVELAGNADLSILQNTGQIEGLLIGVFLSSGADNVVVINDGVIFGDDQGIYSNGTGTVVRNSGTITAIPNGLGVQLDQGGQLINSGDITGFTGVGFAGAGSITNTGEIHGAEYGLELFSINRPVPQMVVQNDGLIIGDSAAAIGSFIEPTTDLVIRNSGILSSDGGPAINVDSAALMILRNDGTISATGGTAVDSTGTRVDRVANTGLIDGDVLLNGGADLVVNGGTILGDLTLGTQDDFYRGTGTGVVTGLVSGGDNNDTLIGGAGNDDFDGGSSEDLLVGHNGDDTMDGGFGNDTLLGGAGDDELSGSNGTDILNGGAGSDSLSGGESNDVLIGQDGSDTLDGGDNDDTLDGGAGDDILEGGDGNDILRGRAGEDEIAGGLGRDFLTGGDGADSFTFRSIAETAVGANRDQILDFEQGVDLIVVAGLSPGVFEFKGTGPFNTAVANPELRLFETATGSTIVQMDIDGDGNLDAEIRVAGVTGLTADDFVL
jgi:Ca2+-binding RTX toxin-like protein